MRIYAVEQEDPRFDSERRVCEIVIEPLGNEPRGYDYAYHEDGMVVKAGNSRYKTTLYVDLLEDVFAVNTDKEYLFSIKNEPPDRVPAPGCDMLEAARTWKDTGKAWFDVYPFYVHLDSNAGIFEVYVDKLYTVRVESDDMTFRLSDGTQEV